MLFLKDKFVFIEVPKTGTSSIAEFFESNYPEVRRNVIVKGSGESISVRTHVTALQVADILGEERKNYKFIAFVREPLSLVYSKYYYYKSGRGREWAKDWNSSFGLKFRVLFAMGLPFWIWAVLYPYKRSSAYTCDLEDRCIVDLIGRYEYLEKDFVRIFKMFGYSEDKLALNKINVSNRPATKSFLPSVVRKVIGYKMKKDILFLKDLSRFD